MSAKRIAVIGSGFGGLSLAVRLQSAGHAVTLYEGRDKPGGRAFCYFDGNDAVIVWTHQRLGQLTHRDVLVTAREGGSDHVSLTRWWRPWHHLIGKAQ